MTIRPECIALYAHYGTGSALPGYVRFALTSLAKTDYTVVLCTNSRELDASVNEFLHSQGIQLFLTKNQGYDFGMWSRYLESIGDSKVGQLHRLLLLNDSVVYYKDVFSQWLQSAEELPADVVGVCSNDEVEWHVQSWWVVCKERSIQHLWNAWKGRVVPNSYFAVVHDWEIGLSRLMRNAGLGVQVLLPHESMPYTGMYMSPDFIAQGRGFVKRKLLEGRFTDKEWLHIERIGMTERVRFPYRDTLLRSGDLDAHFAPSWLWNEVTKPRHPLISLLARKARKVLGYRTMKLWKDVSSIGKFQLASSGMQFHNLGQGLEVGGPSEIFGATGLLPVYKIASRIDNVNFRSDTIWEGQIEVGHTFLFNKNRKAGTQYVSEASQLFFAANGVYDFLISSHMLEHAANPLAVLKEWRRVVKEGGMLLLVVPTREGSFDHRREPTSFGHLLHDWEQNMGEDDQTHLEEILERHDLGMDPGHIDFATLESRSRDNYRIRGMHQHVFAEDVLAQCLQWAGFSVQRMERAAPFHLAALAIASTEAMGVSGKMP